MVCNPLLRPIGALITTRPTMHVTGGAHTWRTGCRALGSPATTQRPYGRDIMRSIAVGALLALMLIALYVRFTPGFNRQKRA